MENQLWNTEKILEKTMQVVAPLPSQAAYAKSLATIFSMHLRKNILMDEGFSADELPSPSAVVVAPTGQGKTYLPRKMAEVLGLNLIIIDCSTLSAEGWRGISLSQRLSAAAEEAKNERTFAQSVLFLDEIDKLRFWGGKNDEGNAVKNLLQLFNGGTVAVERNKKHENIDVSRFTFLFGGAFEGIDKIIQERTRPKVTIGFGSEHAAVKQTKAELMQQVTVQDLTKFGMMPELLGRIGSILTIPPLQLEDYRQLLTAEAGSLHRKYHNYLWNLHGVTFEVADSGVEAIAAKCMTADTGARAINPLVNDMMRLAIDAVESQDSICKVILDADEDGCCVRYEHGPKGYCFHVQQSSTATGALPWHTVKAKNPPALTQKLCRYYRNAGGDLNVLPQLEAFLNCALTFLYYKCRPSEFTFDSLEKLARATKREEDVSSAFDTILKDTHSITFRPLINAFDKVYTSWTTQNLTSALRQIMEYIRGMHGLCQMRFEIPRKTPKIKPVTKPK